MSSWEALKKTLQSSNGTSGKKRRRIDLSQASKQEAGEDTVAAPELPREFVSKRIKERYVALDCEMVGIGPSGRRSALARCSLVDFDGEVIYDKHVRPQSFVTDFRTKYSGIRKSDLRYGKAISLTDCQREVAALLQGKVLVGHALKNDLDVLMLSHSRANTRDTATYRPYMRPHPRRQGRFLPRALKDLSRQFLGLSIQTGEHDPSEDARCAMMLYRRCRKEWEDSLKTRKPSSSSMESGGQPQDLVSLPETNGVTEENRVAQDYVQSNKVSMEHNPKKRRRKSLRVSR